ncbi:hypothetical protein DQG23_04600 [Paenibacillus contaminans]|uniref:Uncharacterized protein n=1 Tax=Paenibacillus contaminans TaxID=450362 RepID=A0A329MWN1_9BACL|nr:hypothetical protein DQG23_04600 [Paenibacillus contaminans]
MSKIRLYHDIFQRYFWFVWTILFSLGGIIGFFQYLFSREYVLAIATLIIFPFFALASYFISKHHKKRITNRENNLTK